MWNLEENFIEDEAFYVESIIHLAGATIAKKDGQNKYKKSFTPLGIDTAKLLKNML